MRIVIDCRAFLKHDSPPSKAFARIHVDADTSVEALQNKLCQHIRDHDGRVELFDDGHPLHYRQAPSGRGRPSTSELKQLHQLTTVDELSRDDAIRCFLVKGGSAHDRAVLQPALRFQVHVIRVDANGKDTSAVHNIHLDELIPRDIVMEKIASRFGVEVQELYSTTTDWNFQLPVWQPLEFDTVGATNGIQNALRGGALRFVAKCDAPAASGSVGDSVEHDEASTTAKYKGSGSSKRQRVEQAASTGTAKDKRAAGKQAGNGIKWPLRIDCGGALKDTNVVFNLPANASVMMLLIDVIHKGKCSVESDAMLRQLLQAAGKYGLTVLEAKCTEHFVKQLSVDNVIDVLEFAELIGAKALRAAVIDFVKGNAKSINANADVAEKLLQKLS